MNWFARLFGDGSKKDGGGSYQGNSYVEKAPPQKVDNNNSPTGEPANLDEYVGLSIEEIAAKLKTAGMISACKITAVLSNAGPAGLAALIEFLASNADPGIKSGVIVGLGRMGSAATPALPVLRELAAHSEPALAMFAQSAIAKIEKS